jgi:hypothetical protein
MENKCGTCTACCRVYAIPEFAKPAGKWCEHCTIGKACNIYETRPQRCVDFKCLWLQSQDQPRPLDPELRPDRCKVVFAPSTNERVMTAITMVGSPDAWQKKVVLKLIDRLNQASLSVAIGPPNADAQLLIKPDGQRYKVKLTPPDKDGMQWSIGET